MVDVQWTFASGYSAEEYSSGVLQAGGGVVAMVKLAPSPDSFGHKAIWFCIGDHCRPGHAQLISFL